MPALLPILKTVLELDLWDSFELFYLCTFNLIYAWKTIALQGSLYFSEHKKVTRAMSGEYGGWDIIAVLFFAKNLQTATMWK